MRQPWGRRARVLTVTRSPVRLANLKAATESVFEELRRSGEDTSAMGSFWFGLLTPAMNGVDLLTKPMWSVAGVDELRALLE